MPDPTDDSSGQPHCPATDAEIDRHAAEAERVIELLSARRSTGQTDLDQRVAAAYPDAVAATAVNLRRLLTHEHSTVQHNAVEALATMVGLRPDVVVPAADTLRGLLNHEEVALQHNAAGLLYVLAEHQPEAVTPAVEELQDLRTHDDDAVRRIATATLARLADERLDATTDSKSK